MTIFLDDVTFEVSLGGKCLIKHTTEYITISDNIV